MILKRDLLSEEPLDVRSKEIPDFTPQGLVNVLSQGGVGGDELEGHSPRLDQHLDVPEELGYLQVRHPTLAAPEERPFAANGEIHLRKLETVLVLAQSFEPL